MTPQQYDEWRMDIKLMLILLNKILGTIETKPD